MKIQNQKPDLKKLMLGVSNLTAKSWVTINNYTISTLQMQNTNFHNINIETIIPKISFLGTIRQDEISLARLHTLLPTCCVLSYYYLFILLYKSYAKYIKKIQKSIRK